MKSIRKKSYFTAFLLGVLVSAALALATGPVRAQAAQPFKEIAVHNDGRIAKCGNYYFNYISDKICISGQEDGAYTETPLTMGFFSDGKTAYYISLDNILYRYTLSSGKTVKIKKLPLKDDHVFSIGAVYGNWIFLNEGSFNSFRLWTRRLDLKTKKLKTVQKDCCIRAQDGKYVVAQKEYRSDISPYALTIYKMTSSGLSKVKELTKKGRDPIFLNGKVYYAAYADANMRNVRVYRCSKTGKNKKKLASIDGTGQYAVTIVTEIKAKKCTVSINNQYYEYVYAKKKLQAIQK